MNAFKRAAPLTSFLIVSILNNYVLSILGSMKVPTEQSLIGRGLICFLVSILVGVAFNERFFPRSLQPQIGRFALAGFGLWAMVESYAHAKASEVSLVSRLDIPVIVLLGFLVSLRTTVQQKVAAIFLIAIILGSLWIFADEQTSVGGLAYAAIGTALLAMSYLLLNHTAKNESPALVSITPAISCFMFGIVLTFIHNRSFMWQPIVILLTFASGVLMYLSYRTVRVLYRSLAFFKAQAAYVLIPLLSIPIDIVVYKNRFRPTEYMAFLVVSIGVLFVCLYESRKPAKALERDESEYCKVTA